MTDTAGPSRTVWDLFADVLALPPFGSLGPTARAAAIPPWLSPALVSTQYAEARLRTWVAGGGLARAATREARLEVAEDVELVADDGLRLDTIGALIKLPPPILEHLRANAVLITLGVRVSGWCVPTRRRAEQTEALRILVAAFRPSATPSPISSEAEFQGTVGHEAAHSWLEAPVPLDAPPRTPAERLDAEDDRMRLHACAAEWRLIGDLAQHAEESERQAGALARALGFVGVGADGDGCARAVRAAIESRAASLHAAHWGRISKEQP